MTDHSAQVVQSVRVRMKIQFGRLDLRRRLRLLVFCLAWTLGFALTPQAQELTNDVLRLKLNISPENVPIIEEATWKTTGKTVFRDLGTPDGISAWFPGSWSSTPQIKKAVWNIFEGDITKAEASCQLANNMLITWVVELPKRSQLFRLHVRLTNQGEKARIIDSFPAWMASWDVGGQSQWARWWRSLEYTRVERSLNGANRIHLGSRLHSSDDLNGGVNPYWVVGGAENRIYFGLQWSGGWNAELQSLEKGFKLIASLPGEETQLVLRNGETIEGPSLLVTPMQGSDESDDRAAWMKLRYSLGQSLYPGPPLTFPLTYNTWYAARRKVDRDFVNAQIAAMPPYSFDAFIIDAGWFASGRWKPDRRKFQPAEFLQTLASLKANGIKPGLWSSPQYVSRTNNPSHLTFETPPVSTKFFDGDLVDISKDDFLRYLTEHVNTLRNTYSMSYWKYDQPLFTERTRAGQMKDVIGFQDAMQAVRRANPNLIIENCLNGGRIINEFTLLATQTTWLNDLGRSGAPDPSANIRVALNALDFVFPWAALRFTINMDRLDETDDEMLRLYCRSAMAGMWGISTDLSTISSHQQEIIRREIENYRWLNRLKSSCLYDLRIPDDDADVAGVTFYSEKQLYAGVLLYRWQATGTFAQHIALPGLIPGMTYRVVDVDTGTETAATGSDLINNGISIFFSGERLSALVILEPVV